MPGAGEFFGQTRKTGEVQLAAAELGNFIDQDKIFLFGDPQIRNIGLAELSDQFRRLDNIRIGIKDDQFFTASWIFPAGHGKDPMVRLENAVDLVFHQFMRNHFAGDF